MPIKPKILLIGIDGLMLHRVLAKESANHLKFLKDNSFFADTEVDLPTVSGPSWSTLLTGKRQDVHKVTDNKFENHNLKEAPDFLTQALKIDPSLVTYVAAGWPPLIDLEDVGPVIADSGHIRFHNDGETLGYLQVDNEVFDHAFETIKSIKPDLSFVYFCGVDEAGHKYGSVNEPYFEAASRIDGYVKKLHELLISQDEQWILIIVTDHGHRDEGGHGGDSPQERASFIIAHGVKYPHPNWPTDVKPHELVNLILATFSQSH